MFDINLNNLPTAAVSALQAAVIDKMAGASQAERDHLQRIWDQIIRSITVPVQ